MSDEWAASHGEPSGERLVRVETKIDNIIGLQRETITRLDGVHEKLGRHAAAIEQLQRSVDGTPGKPDGLVFDVEQLKKTSSHHEGGLMALGRLLAWATGLTALVEFAKGYADKH